jgi:ribosomal protein S2
MAKDAIRAIYLIADIIANAVIEGKQAMTEGMAGSPVAAATELESPEEKPVVDISTEEMAQPTA